MPNVVKKHNRKTVEPRSTAVKNLFVTVFLSNLIEISIKMSIINIVELDKNRSFYCNFTIEEIFVHLYFKKFMIFHSAFHCNRKKSANEEDSRLSI